MTESGPMTRAANAEEALRACSEERIALRREIVALKRRLARAERFIPPHMDAVYARACVGDR